MWMPSLSAVTILLGLVPLLQADQKMVRKVYPVADLVIPMEGMPAGNLDKITAAKTAAFATTYSKDKTTDLSEKLINLISGSINPASWSDTGGPGKIDYFPIGMALVVNQTPEIHQQIAELLQSLRKLQDVQVAIEIRVVRVGESMLGRCVEHQRTLQLIGGCAVERIGVDFQCCEDRSKPIFLNQQQVASLLEATQLDRNATIMQAPKLTLFNGQLATVQSGQTQTFVTELKPTEINGHKVGIPVNTDFFLGSRFDVQGVVSADRKFVTTKLKAEMSELNGPVPLFPITTIITPIFEGGSQGKPVPFTQFIQQPNVQKISVDKTAVIPDGGTMMIFAGTIMTETRTEEKMPYLGDIPYISRLFRNVGYGREAQKVVLLVTPRIIISEEKAQEASLPAEGCLTGTACIAESPKAACPVCTNSKSDASMNLADVVALSSSGVSDDIILNQIHTTGATFKLATEDILFLKKNKVTDAVVLTMQNTRHSQTLPTPMPIPATPPLYAPTMPVSQSYPCPPVQYSCPPLYAPTMPVSQTYQCPPVQPPYPTVQYYLHGPIQQYCQPCPTMPPCPSPYQSPVGGSAPAMPSVPTSAPIYERLHPPAPSPATAPSLQLTPVPVGQVVPSGFTVPPRLASRNEAAAEIGEAIIETVIDLIEGIGELLSPEVSESQPEIAPQIVTPQLVIPASQPAIAPQFATPQSVIPPPPVSAPPRSVIPAPTMKFKIEWVPTEPVKR